MRSVGPVLVHQAQEKPCNRALYGPVDRCVSFSSLCFVCVRETDMVGFVRDSGDPSIVSHGSAPRHLGYRADRLRLDNGRRNVHSTVIDIREDRQTRANSECAARGILRGLSQRICSAGSLVARASSMDSGSLKRVADLSHRAHRGSFDEVVMSEKLLRELRSANSSRGPAAAWGGRNGAEQMSVHAVMQEPVSSDPDADHRRGQRLETDGGVRLAGGGARPREAATQYFNQHSVPSDGSTLPPSYSSDFGNS